MVKTLPQQKLLVVPLREPHDIFVHQLHIVKLFKCYIFEKCDTPMHQHHDGAELDCGTVTLKLQGHLK